MFLHQSLTSSAVKFVPLSVMMLWGTPKRCTTPDMKSIIGPDSAVLTGLASIHLVNLSTMPIKYWCLWVPPLRGPTMSSPQIANGQVERANGLIMSGIKPRLVRSLKESNTHWVEELDSVLWGLRTTPNRTTGYTPFFMVYGAEAVLPCDIIHDSPRVRMYEEREAELDRQDSLDALEEEHDMAQSRSPFYQQQARRYQSREVRAKNYNVGELVLRLPDKKKDKLKPKW